jgi:outer membrane lipoprotein-sorting protein
MKRLRTISTRRLLILVGAVALLALTAGIAQGALSESNPTPPAKPLDQAVVDAVNGPKVDGVTASVTFDNHLLPTGTLPEGSTSPLLSGAKGRLWVTNDGRFRVELQSQSGDAQIVSDGKQLTVYDASSNTAYRFDVPQGKDQGADQQGGQDQHKPLTLDQVDKAINQIAQHWTLSDANPTSTAGQPTYTVRISPKDDGGLLGAAEVAFDANHGIPLRAAVYADNQDSPVLELKADDISYGSVNASDVAVGPPAGAKIVDMSSRQQGAADRAHKAGHAPTVSGVDAVQAKVPFTLVAPDSIAGLPRQGVRLVDHGDGTPGAVAVYGKGLGAIVVLQQDAKSAKNHGGPLGGGGGDREHQLRLPTINIDGATGQELATALGTVVTFERNGVSYTVAGSVPPQAAEQAARELR